MCKRLSSLLLIFFFCLFSFGLIGCDAEKTGDTATTISDTADGFAPLVPLPYRWIISAVSAGASAVASIAYGIKEARGKRAMKRGIQAIGKVIDLAKHSDNEEIRKAAAVVTGVFSVTKSTSNPTLRDDLLFADAVRKGLK